jgi:hypothetical protein
MFLHMKRSCSCVETPARRPWTLPGTPVPLPRTCSKRPSPPVGHSNARLSTSKSSLQAEKTVKRDFKVGNSRNPCQNATGHDRRGALPAPAALSAICVLHGCAHGRPGDARTNHAGGECTSRLGCARLGGTRAHRLARATCQGSACAVHTSLLAPLLGPCHPHAPSKQPLPAPLRPSVGPLLLHARQRRRRAAALCRYLPPVGHGAPPAQQRRRRQPGPRRLPSCHRDVYMQSCSMPRPRPAGSSTSPLRLPRMAPAPSQSRPPACPAPIIAAARQPRLDAAPPRGAPGAPRRLPRDLRVPAGGRLLWVVCYAVEANADCTRVDRRSAWHGYERDGPRLGPPLPRQLKDNTPPCSHPGTHTSCSLSRDPSTPPRPHAQSRGADASILTEDYDPYLNPGRKTPIEASKRQRASRAAGREPAWAVVFARGGLSERRTTGTAACGRRRLRLLTCPSSPFAPLRSPLTTCLGPGAPSSCVRFFGRCPAGRLQPRTRQCGRRWLSSTRATSRCPRRRCRTLTSVTGAQAARGHAGVGGEVRVVQDIANVLHPPGLLHASAISDRRRIQRKASAAPERRGMYVAAWQKFALAPSQRSALAGRRLPSMT